jgi:tonB family C-terminal domain
MRAVASPAADKPAPVFSVGKMVAFEEWLLQSLVFPSDKYKDGEEIRMSASFTITSKGRVKGVELKQCNNTHFGAQVVKALKSSLWDMTEAPADLSRKLALHVIVRKDFEAEPPQFYAQDVKVHSKVDTDPTFQGGGAGRFRQWVKQRVTIPDGVDTLSRAERVVVRFTIEKNGAISGLKAGGTQDNLVDAVERVAAQAPDWTPALVQGERVRMAVSFRIDFGRFDKAGVDEEDEEALAVAEKMPLFLGCDLGMFRKWVMSNVKYPDILFRKGVQGRVLATFVIEKDGVLSSVEIISSPHPLMAEEVEKVLRESPKWTPGEQGGLTVRVRYTLPVDFRLPQDPHRTSPNTQNRNRSGAGFSAR